MMTRICLAKIIPARWSSGRFKRARATAPSRSRLRILAVVCLAATAHAAAPAGDLAALVRSWRDSPAPARRAAIEAYAAAHPRDNMGALAHLALGVGEYEQKDYPSAIAELRQIRGALPQIADYSAYYLAASRVESNDFDGIPSDAAPAHQSDVRSPLAGRAWLVEGRALTPSAPAEAVHLLRDHYALLPQPDGDLALGTAYQGAGDLPRAVEFYQRVYYQYISGDIVDRATAALLALKDSMGAAYPPPLPEQVLRRADRLLELRDYARAKSAYQDAISQLVGLAREQARVRVGAADYLAGKPGPAQSYLVSLDLPEGEADAERLYYLEECDRRLGDDEAMMTAVQRLSRQYPKSLWRLKALLSAANRYLLVNRPDDYVPLYQAAYQDFPSESSAGQSHWKVTFQAYLRDRPEAAALLREHLRDYPGHPTAGAGLYFLGRLLEQKGDPSSARACYQRLSQAFENQYYALLARERLAQLPSSPAAPATDIASFLAGLKVPDARPVPSGQTAATTARIERSRLLRSAGLADLADTELRFGARNGGQPALLGMEMAEAAEAPHQAMHIMKSMAGDYLSLPLDSAPRRYWELLFPLPYRAELTRDARDRDLDPYLLAGLIRQESEFNPQARSRANALGLTQVRPVTGREFARKMGIRQFNSNQLYQPAVNLKIGSSILRSMLDQHGGNSEQTLAAYNAGPARAAEWLAWQNYREPAEFVESIPFTETRDYVQAVLRNADIYRRLYR